MDRKPIKLKSFESSERQRAKREIREEIKEYTSLSLDSLRQDLDQKQAWNCCLAQGKAEKGGKSYRCRCPDPWKMEDEEVLRLCGEML